MSLAEATRPAALRRESSFPPPAASAAAIAARPSAGRPRQRGDAAAFSVMVGIGETYFAAFALALGTGETFAGLVATLPMLAGALLHSATPVVLGAGSLLPEMGRALRELAGRGAAADAASPHGSSDRLPPQRWVFCRRQSLYWAASQATGPAWNTWIEEIVPRRLRATFFACRARVSQACTLAGFMAGGIALQVGKANGWLLAAFASIFLVGSGCRFLSAWFLSRQSEPSRGRYRPRQVPRPRNLHSRASGEVGTPLVCICWPCRRRCKSPAPISRPTCWPSEKLSYLSYMLLIGIAYFGKVIAMPLWGRVAHKPGARRLLWIGGTSIVPVAALWIGAELCGSGPATLAYIGLVQLISGIVWAAYELAMMLMFFEAIPRQDRASVLTFTTSATRPR